MNEKLQALRRQAVITSSNKIRAESGTSEIDEDAIQRILELRVEFDKTFAELIIKECIDLMKESQAECRDNGRYGSTEYFDLCCAQAAAFESAASSIKHHFSV